MPLIEEPNEFEQDDSNEEFDREVNSNLTPDEVADKWFRPTRFTRGYNEDDVDDFLDDVEATLVTLRRKVNDAEQDAEQHRRVLDRRDEQHKFFIETLNLVVEKCDRALLSVRSTKGEKHLAHTIKSIIEKEY